MAEKMMLIDLDQCVRCYACQAACLEEKGDPQTGMQRRQITTLGPRKVQEELQLDFVPSACLHCDDAPCRLFCPTDAIVRRPDGVVLFENERCNGCQLCVFGCPYGVIWFDEERDLAVKCDLCVQRLDYGLEPRCVQHCLGGALLWVAEDDLERLTRGRHRSRVGKTCYVSAKWALSLPL